VAEALALTPPTFDIVRVDAAGTAVVAGRGVADARVSLLANGAHLMDAEVDSRGEWVAIVSDPLPVGAVELALEMSLDDGRTIRSDQVVVVSIPETRDTRPLVILGRPGGASEVLQSPLEDEGMEFALLAIDYDDAGGVIFSGRARPDAGVRVIANGSEVGTTRADGIGRWTLTATSTLPPGRYDLQIDQLDEEGRVTAVLALPFERATPEELAEIGPRSVIVQPGNSLWRIARRLYGSGWQYTVIYAANREQIRDPDLIYPGQIFDAPEAEQVADTQG
jgi:nucleoid-associated protein YgaU